MRRYTLWDEMQRMHDEMNQMFHGFWPQERLLEGPRGGEIAPRYRQPLSNFYETNKELVAEVEMPGMDKKDIKINVTEDKIEVQVESKAETKQEDQKKGFYRYERNYSGFYRCFALPKNVDTEKAKAEYKDGVLKITVPKLEIKEAKKKLLEVK